MYDKLIKLCKELPGNVYAIGCVGFLMQFGATMVYASGQVFVADNFMTVSQLLLLRSLTESVPHTIKVLSGFLSDKFENRRTFLLFGYGSAIMFKICFLICSLKPLFKNYYPAASVDWWILVLFACTQLADRFTNATRDATRDSLIVDSCAPQTLGFAFGFRKAIASLGSVLGGLFTYFVIYKGILKQTGLYTLSTLVVIVAVGVLYFSIKDVKAKILVHKSEPFNWSLWGSIVGLGGLSYFIPGNVSGVLYLSMLGLMLFMPEKPFTMKNLILGAVLSISLWFGSLPIFLGCMALSAVYLISNEYKYYAMSGFVLGLGFIIYSLIPLEYTVTFGFPVWKAFTILGFLIGSLLLKNPLFLQVFNNNPKLKNFGLLLCIGSLLTFCRFNDTVVFVRGINLGMSKITTILMFTYLFLIMTVCSFIFSFLTKNKHIKMATAMIFISLIGSNILLIYLQTKVGFWLALSCLGLYSSGVETILTTLVSRVIPNESLRGTIFGIFYGLTGIMTILSALFVTRFTATHSILFVAKSFLVISSAALILFLMCSKLLYQEKE